MIKLPKSLFEISSFLNSKNITTILIGGAVRDYFLYKNTTDFDIEVYGCENISLLKEYLNKFGKVDTKGSKFGILSVNIDNNSYDFALPRTEEKISKGHFGFKITTYKTLDFNISFKRRDFTINAIGYNIQTKKFIDPFNGIDDVKNKILRHIDKNSFIEDPLRVYRAMQFIARFELYIDNETLKLCKNIIEKNLINELSKKQIQKEFNKIDKKSRKSKLFIEFLSKINLK